MSKIPNFENLTITDLVNIKNGKFPKDFPEDSIDIFNDIGKLVNRGIMNKLISQMKKMTVETNPLITDIRKGKNLHDQISDLNGRGFDILNDSGKLPMKFEQKFCKFKY